LPWIVAARQPPSPGSSASRFSGQLLCLLLIEDERRVRGDDLPASVALHPHVRRSISAIDVEVFGFDRRLAERLKKMGL
jgi:hypothetical protein